MKTILIIAVIAFAFCVKSNAQETEVSMQKTIIPLSDTAEYRQSMTPEDRSLTYEETLWGLRTFNGKLQLSNKEVKSFLQRNPQILRDYKKGHRRLITGGALTVAGVFTLGYGVFVAVNAYSDDYGFDRNDRALGFSLIGGGALLATGGVLLFFNGQDIMKLAINAHNDEEYIRTMRVGFTPNGFGLTFDF